MKKNNFIDDPIAVELFQNLWDLVLSVDEIDDASVIVDAIKQILAYGACRKLLSNLEAM